MDHNMTNFRNPKPWLVLATTGWLAIIVLSLVPSAVRPHSGAGGSSEHFLAYALVAACFTIAVRGHNLTRLLAFLAIGSGILELLQQHIPGRTAEWAGFYSASAGVLAGFVVVRLCSRAFR